MESNRNTLLVIRMVTDLTMVSIAWVLAYYIRFYTVFTAPKGIPDPTLYFKLTPFVGVIWLITFATSGFYRRTGRHRSAFVEGIDIIQSCFFATLAFVAFSYFYEEYRYSRGNLIIFCILHPLFVIQARSVIRKILRYRRRKGPKRRTLIIGSGALIDKAVALSDANDLIGCELVGVVPVGNEDQNEVLHKFCDRTKIPVLDTPTNWQDMLIQHEVQSIIFALPNSQYHFLEDHLNEIAEQVPDVRMIPDLFRFTRVGAGVDVYQGMPVLSIHESPLNGSGRILKRLMDVCGALFGLILTAPLLLLVALLVKLTSRGPILYRQERMGMDGHSFTILKFRTMPVDAEKRTGAVWATQGDARPTWLGKFLRKTSIDELPQLFNILVGDMSLVGPRPERPVFVKEFRKQVPGYMLRHKVKAGLTGWAQVNGWRGNTSLDKRIECDLYYIQNWSVLLDLRIIGLTIVRVLFAKNAY